MYFVFQLHFFLCNLYLKYNLGQTENKSKLPAMNGLHHMLRYIQPHCTIQIRVKELRYLSVHILQYVRLNVHYQITEKQFIARQMGLIVSEDVILQLIKSTCISSLLYCVDACALTKSVYV